MPPNPQSANVFLSYRRAEPDQSIVIELQKKLEANGHRVFRDVQIPVGTRWAEEIQHQLTVCDVFIVFLSEQSVDRDMVREEVKQVYYRHKSEDGRPLILPVRLNYEGALPYDLNAWLSPIQYALWKDHSDTEKVAEQLVDAVSLRDSSQLELVGKKATSEESLRLLQNTEDIGRPLPKAEPAVLDVIGMKAGSRFYIDRDIDKHFLDRFFTEFGGRAMN